jgi:hypothetical protein
MASLTPRLGEWCLHHSSQVTSPIWPATELQLWFTALCFRSSHAWQTAKTPLCHFQLNVRPPLYLNSAPEMSSPTLSLQTPTLVSRSASFSPPFPLPPWRDLVQTACTTPCPLAMTSPMRHKPGFMLWRRLRDFKLPLYLSPSPSPGCSYQSLSGP